MACINIRVSVDTFLDGYRYHIWLIYNAGYPIIYQKTGYSAGYPVSGQKKKLAKPYYMNFDWKITFYTFICYN